MLGIVALLAVAPLLSLAALPLPIPAPAARDTAAVGVRSPAAGPKPLVAAINLGLTTSTPNADPKGLVGFTLYYNNTGDLAAPDAWINVTAPAGLIFRGDTASGNVSGYPHYHFAPVGLGLHAFQMTFQVAIGTAPGSVLSLSSSMLYSDGSGVQHFVGPASASVQIGLQTKSLFLGWSPNPAGVLRPASPTGGLVPQGTFALVRGTPASFDLVPALARDFRAFNASAVLYVQPISTPGDLYLNLTLIDVNGLSTTPVASIQQENTVTGPGYWTFFYTFPTMNYLFVTGHQIRLQVLNTAQSTKDATLATNATAEPSHVSMVTTTYVSVDSLSPSESPPTDLSPKSTLVIAANVSDPFGSSEITDVRLNVTGPSGPLVSWLSLLPPVAVDPSSPSAWALFRYARPPLLPNGSFSIELTAIERNGVMDIAAGSFTVRAPVFAFEKVASVDQSKGGGKFTYTIWYNNTGAGPAGTAWINDTLPSPLTFLSSTPTYTTLVGSTYGWVDSYVAPGSHSIQISVQVKGGNPGVGYLRNWASLNFTDEHGFLWPSEVSRADVVLNGPVLSLGILSSPSPWVHSRQPVLYTISMTNAGDVAKTIWLNITLPTELAWVSDTSSSLGGTRTIVGNRIDYVFTNMPSGTSNPVTWTFTLDAQASPNLVAGMDLWTSGALNATSANDVLMPEHVAVVSLLVASPAIASAAVLFGVPAAAPNQMVPVYVNFTNTGNEPASVVWINVTLDPYLEFAGSSFLVSLTGTSLFLRMTDVPNRTVSALLYLIALPTVGGVPLRDGQSLTLSGTLASADGFGNVLGTLDLTPGSLVVALPRVNFTLSPSSRVAEAGTPIQYTIAGGNSGNGIAEAVWLNLTLPASLTYASDSFGVTPSVLGSVYSWAWTNYAPGMHTYLLNLTASGAALDRATADVGFRLDVMDEGGYSEPPVTFGGQVSFLAPAWFLSITADRATLLASGRVNYSVRVENVGSTAARTLWLLLPLDPNLLLITHTAPVPATGTETLNWTFPDVQPGQTLEFNVLVQVAPGTPTNTLIAEALEAHFTNSLGTVLGYVRSSAAQVDVQADFMPIVYILAFGWVAGVAAIFLVYRRYRVRVEDVFLIYRDGILVSHLANATAEGKDEDQLSGMLTAVQDFVQDAFAYGEHRELHQLEFGDYHILIERGKLVYLAVVYMGRDSGLIRKKVRTVLDRIESAYGSVLEKWDGDMHPVEGTRDLLREGFLEEDHPWSLVKSKGP